MTKQHSTSSEHNAENDDSQPAITFDFEEYTEIPQSTGRKLYASLYPNGQLRLNRKTFAAIGEPKSILLLFDKHRRVIGIKPTRNTEVLHAVRVRFHGSEIAVPVTRFLERHKIRPAYTIKFLEPYIQDGVLILDLNRTGRAIGSHTIARERREAAEREAAEKPRKIRGAY